MKNVVNHVPDPDEGHARAGIFAPEPVILEIGTRIYRFASSTPAPGRPPGAVVGYHAGPWWVRHQDFDAIVERAQRAGVDLGQTARWQRFLSPWTTRPCRQTTQSMLRRWSLRAARCQTRQSPACQAGQFQG